MVPDSHLSHLEPSLATEVENVIVPLVSGIRLRQFSCDFPSKFNNFRQSAINVKIQYNMMKGYHYKETTVIMHGLPLHVHLA